MISTTDENTNGQDFNNSQIDNLIFVDTNLTNYQSLIPDTNNSNVVLIDSQENGIEKITTILEQYSNLESVSIFSHGDVGSIQLGDTYLSNSNLDSYQDDLAIWGSALSLDGDLLLYGCNVGGNQEGLAFVNEIANLTNAEIAASNDLTGNVNLGGDWTLEVATGQIETPTFAVTEYGNLLAISQQDLLTGTTADFNGDGKADLLRQEKADWDDDWNDTAKILISTGTDFNTIDLSESLGLKGDFTNLYVGDFNGDGKSDLLRQEKWYWDNDNSGTAHLLISTGNGFNKINLPEKLDLKGDYTNLYVGDYNGDGKSDLLRQEKADWDDDDSNTAHLLISTGDGFNKINLPENLELKGDYTNLYVGDFNGDGKADLLRQEKGELDNDSTNDAHLLISNGTSFNKISLAQSFDLHGDVANIFIGDYNGDGKSDLLRQEKANWDNANDWGTAAILTSTGTNFTQHSQSPDLKLQGDYTNLFVGDFNGDGKDDVLRQEKGTWDNDENNTANLLISSGTSFNKIVLAENLNMGGDYNNLYAGDFSGDGKTDLIRQEKGWLDNYNNSTSEFLKSTGTGFNQLSITSSSMLSGNYNNLITSNVLTNYLKNLDNDGLKFKFTYDNNVSWHQKKAFEFAGEMWSEFLADDVTVNIHISMVDNSDLPSNTLGGAVPFFHQGESYTNFKNQLSQDIDYLQNNARDNFDDEIALENLDAGSTYQVAAPGDTNSGVQRDFNRVAMTRANAKALGFIDSDDKTLDATIVMNNLDGTGVSWQYDYFSDSVGASKIDFTTVAMHEIGHSLGFVSIIDGLGNDNYQDQTLLNDSVTALDLFRFSQGNQGIRSIRTEPSFLSLDGGTNNLGRTSYGVTNIGGDYYADGYQGSHWKNEDDAGIMDPVLETNLRRQIGELDLRALDIIGWDRKFAANSSDVLINEAMHVADNKGHENRNVEIGEMFEDWRWARRGSRDRLRQEGNIAQFLAQEGFFSVGAFRESFDFSSVNSVSDRNFILITDNQIEANEFQSSQNSDLVNSAPIISENKMADVATEVEGVDYEQMLALVTKDLSDYEVSQLSLDDLGKLIEQQLVESLV